MSHLISLAAADAPTFPQRRGASSHAIGDCVPITSRTRELVIESYTVRGMTIAEIAAELEIGRETVRGHLIAAGVPRRLQKARQRTRPEAKQEAIELYRSGATLATIATQFKVTPTAVRAWLIEAGVPRRRPGVAVAPDSTQETVSLYDSGLTINAVAAAQGLHPWTVRQRLINAGVARRARGRQPKDRAGLTVHTGGRAVSAQ